METFGPLQRTERTIKLPIDWSCRDISCLIDAWNWSEESNGLTGSFGWPCMLRVRKRCVNWLYLAISWSGPCCPVFLGPDGGDGGLLGPTWKGSRRSGRGLQGSGHLFVEAARPDTPLVFLRPSSLGALEGRVKRRSTRKKGALSSGTHGHGTRRRVLDIWDTATSRCSIFLFFPLLSPFDFSLRTRFHLVTLAQRGFRPELPYDRCCCKSFQNVCSKNVQGFEYFRSNADLFRRLNCVEKRRLRRFFCFNSLWNLQPFMLSLLVAVVIRLFIDDAKYGLWPVNNRANEPQAIINTYRLFLIVF